MVGIDYSKLTKQECIFLQLDLGKDYDWIGWSFIFKTMETLGFESKMSHAIVDLSTRSSSHLLFNNRIVGFFKVCRSIKQCYLLALLLFAICLHPFVITLELESKNYNVFGICLAKRDQLLVKMFAYNSQTILCSLSNIIFFVFTAVYL